MRVLMRVIKSTNDSPETRAKVQVEVSPHSTQIIMETAYNINNNNK